MSDWARYIEHAFRCPCGEWIGICAWPHRSFTDGRELGTSYLRLDPDRPNDPTSLWKLHSGDAGHFDQRCSGCDELLVQAPAQKSMF